ncbi:MAG: histidine kinase [Bacteroidales bacterium]
MAKKSSKKWLMAAIHVIAWGLLICLPLMFSNSFERALDLKSYLLFTIVPVAHMIVFYTNYFIFINNYLFKKHLANFLFYNVLLIIFIALAIHLCHELLNPGHPSPPLYIWLLRDSIIFMFTATLSVAIKVTVNWYKTENQRQEIEKEKAAAELKNLKSQLNPHFLFNTLNNIYSLVSINPAQAQYAILSLSQLLRYVLYDNNQLTLPLSKELSFVKSYIELMTLRLSEKVKLSVSIPDPEEDKGLLIAPLLFITLIENAFKHGISPTGESKIDILIELNELNTITCKIENSYYPKSDMDRSGSGIGLENLRKRLDLIYPGKYLLISERVDDMYVSQLTIVV